MPTPRPLIAALLCLAWPAAAADPVAAPPVRITRADTAITVQADGTAVQRSHLEFAVATDAAARGAAQQSASFLDGVERLTLVEAATVKPDGRRIPVDPAAVRTQAAPGVPNVPMYTNRRVMTAVLPAKEN